MERIVREVMYVLTRADFQEIRYIDPPRRNMLKAALKYNGLLFLMYFFSRNLVVFLALVPIYTVLIFIYYAMLVVFSKYGYKMYVMVTLSIIFNFISFLFAGKLFKLLVVVLGVVYRILIQRM